MLITQIFLVGNFYMSALVPPLSITRPKGFGRKPNNYWTLHSAGNNAFTLRLNEELRTSVVGFKKKDDAVFIAKMIETHYIIKKEWPDTHGELILPTSQIQVNENLTYLYIHKWDFEDLKVLCTRNVMDLISVENLIKTEQGYSFEGNLFKFDGSLEFYKDRFEEYMRNP